MKSVYQNILLLSVILFLVLVFFGRLFYPHNSIFMIPDFGTSNVLHFYLPLKHLLSVNLKNGIWPLWTEQIAGGFPILAQGQIGTFYLPNLLLFRFLPMVTAYNLNLIIAYLMLVLGTYLFSRLLGLKRISSFFVAIFFTFSGFFAVHLNHYDIILTSSLMPLLFWQAYRFWNNSTVKNAIIFAVILSQQIFAGYLNIVFISLVGILVFWTGLFIWQSGRDIKDLVTQKISWIILSFFFTFLFSAIQLFPTIELWRMFSKNTGLDFDMVTAYPYPLKHLLAFLNPYIFGNPADGSYPGYSDGWGIFWENTAYLGIIPLILAFLSLLLIKKRRVKIFFVIFVLSILLVLGKNSPFYFIFSLPPFNFFRVPSKFLLLTAFSLSMLTGITLNQIYLSLSGLTRQSRSLIKLDSRFRGNDNLSQNLLDNFKKNSQSLIKFVICFLLFVIFLTDEFSFSYNYPPASPADWWINNPAIIQSLDYEPFRLKSYAAEAQWNDIFLKHGWRNLKDYLPLNNSLFPNYNVLFDLNQTSLNMGRLIPRRTGLWISVLDEVKLNSDDKSLKISPSSISALNLWGTDTIISGYQISVKEWNLTNEIKSGDYTFKIYRNILARKPAYFASDFKRIDTVEDFYLQLENIGPKTVLMEYKGDLNFKYPNNDKILLLSKQPHQEIYQIASDTKALFVLNKSFYPGWRFYLDGNPQELITVNLNQPAVYIPPGQHKLEYVFVSKSFELGKLITLMSYVIAFLAVFLASLSFPRKSSGSVRLFSRLWRKGNN